MQNTEFRRLDRYRRDDRRADRHLTMQSTEPDDSVLVDPSAPTAPTALRPQRPALLASPSSRFVTASHVLGAPLIRPGALLVATGIAVVLYLIGPAAQRMTVRLARADPVRTSHNLYYVNSWLPALATLRVPCDVTCRLSKRRPSPMRTTVRRQPDDEPPMR